MRFPTGFPNELFFSQIKFLYQIPDKVPSRGIMHAVGDDFLCFLWAYFKRERHYPLGRDAEPRKLTEHSSTAQALELPFFNAQRDSCKALSLRKSLHPDSCFCPQE